MDAEIRTLEDIFSSPVQLLVPLYQRPYVWEQGKQWEPLWDDVRSVADRLRDHLAAGVAPKKAQTLITPHFMGAVVLQQIHTAIGEMDRFAVIDGQQRLTTMQLLVDAAHAIVAETGDAERANLLELLVKNTHKVKADDDAFKVLPTNVDRSAFRAVMEAAPPVLHATLADAKARVVEAHRYFSDAVTAWVAEGENEEDKKLRVNALTTVLLGMLTTVVIELGKDENAQLIFETLNARNTPLLASDLVKNVLFQRIEEEDPGKSDALYQKYWSSLDHESWRKTVRQGRLVRPRLDLFLYYWLIMHTGKSVTSHEVFSTIREMLDDESAPKSPTALLTTISANAAKYDAFEKAAPASALGIFRYRVIDVMQTDAVTPVLLWLHDPTRTAVPQVQIDLSLSSLESWAVRRMLCRLTTKDYNKMFLDLVEDLNTADRSRAGEQTRFFIAKQTADSRLWPADSAVHEALLGAEVYRTLSRTRLRMVLEAIEDRLRTSYSEQGVDRGVYTIEHVLPQSWQTHWPIEGDDPALGRHRNHLLHTLGNLTLVTKRLNPKLSNGAWATKRSSLADHSVLRLNHELLSSAADAWTEEKITQRSARLGHAVIACWPRPSEA
jgi:hypothetical protein